MCFFLPVAVNSLIDILSDVGILDRCRRPCRIYEEKEAFGVVSNADNPVARPGIHRSRGVFLNCIPVPDCLAQLTPNEPLSLYRLQPHSMGSTTLSNTQLNKVVQWFHSQDSGTPYPGT